MNKSLAIVFALAVAACRGGDRIAQQTHFIPAYRLSASVDASAPQDWLTQKVCVDSNDVPVSVDPYGNTDSFGNGCAGYVERDMQPGDAVPYYRYVNTGNGNFARDAYAYAYPVTSAGGETMYVMAREFAPLNHQPATWYVNPVYYPGHTHWDMYRIENGWVSDATTRDNSGLNQIFLGNSGGMAVPYNGWLSFPLTYLGAFGTSGQTNVPVSDLYWEQSGLPWPVPMQAAPLSKSTQTTWTLLQNYTFDSGKTMNALVAYHQSKPQPASKDPEAGHMEVWYFTLPYGPTRWEEWSAATCLGNNSCLPKLTQYCAPSTPQTFPYGGIPYTYYRTNCVDYSHTMTAASGSTVPVIPVPETNLLSNFHFSNDPPGGTTAPTAWTSSGIALTQLQSKLKDDTNRGKYPGARYLQVTCASGSCTSGSVLSQSISSPVNGVYAFGVDARTESGTGAITVSLQQLDASGNVLDSSTVTQTITPIGDSTNCSPPSSIVNCSTFVGERVSISLVAGAAQLALVVTPQTSGTTYDITDAYLGRQ